MTDVRPEPMNSTVVEGPDPNPSMHQLVMDHLPFSVFWKDQTGRIVGVNRTLMDTFAPDGPVDIVGLTLAELLPDGGEYDALHRQVMDTGETIVHDDFEANINTSGDKHLRRSIFPLLDSEGTVVGMMSMLEDRTDVANLERQLTQAQKLESVGQLAAGIAHEINTPMQYIGDNTHFLKATLARLLAIGEAAEKAVADGATDDDRVALAKLIEKSKLPMLAERAPKAAEDALAGVENVSRIVTAMKRFSHPGSDEMEPVDLNEAITTTMTVCRNEWKYSADIETDLAEDLPIIEGRLGPLNQVWLNMIVNATHAIADRYGDDKGVITITTGVVDDGRAVRVTIGDNGAGISRENVDRIFDHFFTTKPVGKGTGQGLAIAHQVIVSEHHGAISVESTLGEGTTFIMTLPTKQSTDETAED